MAGLLQLQTLVQILQSLVLDHLGQVFEGFVRECAAIQVGLFRLQSEVLQILIQGPLAGQMLGQFRVFTEGLLQGPDLLIQGLDLFPRVLAHGALAISNT